MRLNVVTNKAAQLFFSNTSLQYVYYEAIANAIDAHATKIEININIDKFSDVSTFNIAIKDNGDGFTDENFDRFRSLLAVADESHKGLGRLVYITYFNKIKIESAYGKKKRKFVFDNSDDDNCEIIDIEESKHYTLLKFENYNKTRIYDSKFIIPYEIKEDILRHFYPSFFQMKKDGKQLEILISLEVASPEPEKGLVDSSVEFNISEIPELEKKEMEVQQDFFAKYTLLYSIKQTLGMPTVLISALCSDGRTIAYNAVSKNNLPAEYEMVFLLESELFEGKTNPNRESLDVDEELLKSAKKAFTKMVADVIREKLPEIASHNKKIQDSLHKKFPHLVGYFEEDTIGLIDKDSTIYDAQVKFFNEQRKTLEADKLDDKQYELSLNVASRVLTEYILYRTKIIEKLKSITPSDKESSIHNIIAPKTSKFTVSKKINDIYNNNVWVLDDKYMAYSKILSDKELEDIYGEIHVKGSLPYAENGEKKESGRPDLTIVFSDAPECEGKIDVVIVELKRLGIDLAKREEIISQLKQRARRLMEFYPDKIQRIWFYGVIDFDKEFKSSLIENGYKKIFSFGENYYNKEHIIVDPDNIDNVQDIDVFILDYKALLEDAEKRNSTFLDILKTSIQNSIKKESENS